MTRDTWERGCALLCLLTRAAWEEGMPPPLTRQAVRKLEASGALHSLVLRDDPEMEEETASRVRALLARTKAVFRLMEAYERQGYRLMLPADSRWPHVLDALGAQAPLFLFYHGNARLPDHPRMAVAGSRDIAPLTADMARRLGRMLAQEGITLVSGGARGVDLAAQRALLEAGGSMILVPALPVSQVPMGKLERRAMEEGRMLILCDTLPDEPFSAAKALARNHTIYALGDAALVVAARRGLGGSWRGAIDCLRGGWSPVYAAYGEGRDFDGNRALRALGARGIDLSGEKDLLGQLTARLEQTAIRLP